MRAFVLPDFEQAPEVREVPVPEPGEGEVRVKVHAASVNGVVDQAFGHFSRGTLGKLIVTVARIEGVA